MKVFGKLLAILALVLVLGAMLLSGFGLVMRDVLAWSDYSAMSIFYTLLTDGTAYLMQLVCIVPLIFLVGRKKGSAVPEILLLLFIFLIIPVVNAANRFIGEIVCSAFNDSQWYGTSFMESLLELFENVNALQLLLAFLSMFIQNESWYVAANDLLYIVECVVDAEFESLLDILPWVLSYNFAFVAEILTLIACGISAGLLVKNKKDALEEACEDELYEEEPNEEEESFEIDESYFVKEPIVAEEPVVAEAPAVAEEPVTAPEPIKKQAVRVVPVKRVAKEKGE